MDTLETQLFTPVSPSAQLNAAFQRVASDPGFAPARATMQATFSDMGSRDPNFIQQFQTTGFDARVFELYLFAAFRNAGFDVRFEGQRPDFLLCGNGYEWAVEATTANPAGGGSPPRLPNDSGALEEYIFGEHIIRLGGALYSKLQRRYWELPQVAGKPFVIALESFASESAQQLSDNALTSYFFGLQIFGEPDAAGRLEIRSEPIAEHSASKTIPSNFFAAPSAEHVSAVLWTNSGTVPKFARMGFQRGLESHGIRMTRRGLRYVMNADARDPAPFSYEVGARWEPWEEGLAMTHNPNATKPLPIEAFPGIVHHELRADGLVETTVPRFRQYGLLVRPVRAVERAGPPTLFVG